MKTDSTTLLAPQHRRTLMMILVSALLALALASALAVFTGIVSHPTATGARPSGTGFALQDLPGTQPQVAAGRLVRVWAGVCATAEGKYRFDRTELDYGPGGGSAVTAGGRIYDYLVTEDDDEYAPLYCRSLTP